MAPKKDVSFCFFWERGHSSHNHPQMRPVLTALCLFSSIAPSAHKQAQQHQKRSTSLKVERGKMYMATCCFLIIMRTSDKDKRRMIKNPNFMSV